MYEFVDVTVKMLADVSSWPKCRHVCLPGRLLLDNLSLEVSFGERLLVILPASGGKSLSLGMKLKENIVNVLRNVLQMMTPAQKKLLVDVSKHVA